MNIPNESGSKWYLHHLDKHITESKKQILGQGTILVPNKRNPNDTIVPPSNSIWTPEEKESFFALLSRHSRYRVDLISEELKSKTPEEIEWYLDLLELGSRIVGQVDRKRSQYHENLPNERKKWDGVRSWRGGIAPGAREISDRWIEKEEELSEIVINQIHKREQEEKSILKRRERKLQRKALSNSISLGNFEDDDDEEDEGKKPIDASTAYRRNKILENHPTYRKMENDWEINDYLESINSENLTTINNLLKPDWSNWYSDRVRGNSRGKFENHDIIENEELEANEEKGEAGEEDNTCNNNKPIKGDPKGKIIIDQMNYENIITIPKKERTNEQKKLLAEIINRRRNREKYRVSKLIKEKGLTKDEIDLAGGADAIFASLDQNQNENQNENQDDIKLENDLPNKLKRLNQASKEIMQNEATLSKLRRIGMYDHLLLSGIEVFNFKMIERVTRLLNPDQPRHLSYPVLKGIHTLLVHQLRQLIYHSITIAEQSNHQQPPLDEETVPTLNADHVHQALLRANLKHPQEIIQDFIDRIFQDDEGEDDKERTDDKDEELVRIPQYNQAIFPPGEIPWRDIPFISTQNTTQNEHDDEGKDNIQDILEDDGLSDCATELEDNELDAALNTLDEAYDRTHEDLLWASMKNDKIEEFEESHRIMGNVVDDMRQISRLNKEEIKAEQEYLSLLLQIDSSRRKRKYVERQQQRYPTYRIKLSARSNRRMKSTAWIIDSDIDSDEDDNNYVWNPNKDDSDIGMTEEEQGDNDNDDDDENQDQEEEGQEDEEDEVSDQEEQDELLENEKGDEGGR
ncbi:uncharacterized protein L201_006353 [Kwoniella dendrophila CBS 6074]|uniref:Myb-like domain-containing protein n=1 Tax=Kwoniella dendrophila CBS 6074 TaxID=1295534 RepID=A0AAX4K1Z6_9TREE